MTLSHGQVCEALLAERRWELDGAGPQRWTDFQGLECGQIKSEVQSLCVCTASPISLSNFIYYVCMCVYQYIKNIIYNIIYTI